MEIEVVTWEKYNPRKDLKSMPWFRLNADIGYSETLFELNPEQKWLWIFVLSTCTKKCSGRITVNPRFFAYHSGVREQNILKHIQVFVKRGLIRLTNESDRISTDQIENVPNERTNEHNEPVRTDFDFDKIYALYPRKEGKKKGVEKLIKIILTQTNYDDLSKSVANYAKLNRQTEKTYIKQFSSFVNCYEDYINIEVEKTFGEKIEEVLGGDNWQ